MPDSPNEFAQNTQRESERAVREAAAWTVSVVAQAIEDASTPR